MRNAELVSTPSPTFFLRRFAGEVARATPVARDGGGDGGSESTSFTVPHPPSTARAVPLPRNSGGGKNDAGYTLMELLVVLAILGLLAAIATPMVLHYLDSAKLGTAKTEIANYSAGLDLFKYDVGRYPTTQEGLESLVKAPPTVENWNGPYVKVTNSLNDPWGHPFIYAAPGQHGEFDLYSYGPKGKEGAGDAKPAIANW